MAGENIAVFNGNSVITNELQDYFKSNGYKTFFLGDVDEINTHFKDKPPDLIIIEIFSLTPNTLTIIDFVKDVERLSTVPRIAVLNRATRQLVLEVVEIGFNDIMVKPINKEALLQSINKLVAPKVETKETEDGFALIELNEKLDVTNSLKVDTLIEHLITSNITKVIFDLSKISYIDSSGIGILIVCKKKLEVKGGTLKLTNIDENIRQIFTSLHIDKLIEIAENVKLKTTVDDQDSGGNNVTSEVEEHVAETVSA